MKNQTPYLDPKSSKPKVFETNDSPRPITKAPIYPCCCGANQESFFYVFTIILMFDQLFVVMSRMALAIDITNGFNIVSFLFACLFLAWIIKILFDYRQNGNYATDYAYTFSIVLIILSCISTLIMIYFLIYFTVIRTQISKITTWVVLSLEMNLLELNVFILLALLICLYMIYLSSVYCFVIKNKRREMQKMAIQGYPQNLEQIEQDLEETHKTELNEENHIKANLV
jgi:hypothetical protein